MSPVLSPIRIIRTKYFLTAVINCVFLRPVDVDFDACGRLLVSSDGGGSGSKIVRIEYHGEESAEEIPPARLPVIELVAQTFVLKLFEAYLGFSGISDELLGDGPLTIFPPWDPAFRGLPEDWIRKLQSRQWGAHLQDILRCHVFAGDLPLTSLQENQTISMLNGDDVAVTRLEGSSRVRVNGILVLAPYDATNGFAYMLDGVLLPSWIDLTLQDVILATTGVFSSFAVWITRTGLESLINNPDEAMTIFVPDNDAIENLDQAAADYFESEEGVELLGATLRYHLVQSSPLPSRLFFASINTNVTTVEGTNIELVDNDPVTVRGTFNEAKLITVDRLANNGLIHVIDSVLLLGSVPPASR